MSRNARDGLFLAILAPGISFLNSASGDRWAAQATISGTMMTPDVQTKSAAPVQLEHILASVVVLNWDALAASSPAGRVRVEYHIGLDGSVECLKMWGSVREYWSLICDYSVNPSWSDGPRFSNGFHSRPLGRLLQAIMMNQNLFCHVCEPNSNGLFEIGAPTMEDTDAARLRVSETFQRPS
jgi:hypothetical protein